MANIETDVLIVGTGPAGSVTALTCSGALNDRPWSKETAE